MSTWLFSCKYCIHIMRHSLWSRMHPWRRKSLWQSANWLHVMNAFRISRRCCKMHKRNWSPKIKSKSVLPIDDMFGYSCIFLSRFEAQLQAVRERLEQARTQKSQQSMSALNFGRIAKPLRGGGTVVENGNDTPASPTLTDKRDKRTSFFSGFMAR